ncbi:MAG: phage major capsid protein [Polaromonas sp.]|nr:phage major capsid protein [Polaromonas sp.]
MSYTYSQAKGRSAGRYFKALAVNRGDAIAAGAYIDRVNWSDAGVVKAAINALTTGDASSLADDVAQDYLAQIYPATILGRLSLLRRVPARTTSLRQTSGARAQWVGEGAPKPLSVAGFAREPGMALRKVVAMAVIPEELARVSNAEDFLLRDLNSATIAELDASFIDPASAEVEGERPASITFGVAPKISAGNPAADLQAAIAALVAAGGRLESAAWVLHPQQATALNLRGAPFDKISALGGQLAGLPAVTSSAAPSTAIVLLDQGGIELAGGNDATLRVSTEAAIVMSDSPSTDGQLTSLWQTNSIALLAEIAVNFRVARPGTVVVIEGADYGSEA